MYKLIYTNVLQTKIPRGTNTFIPLILIIRNVSLTVIKYLDSPCHANCHSLYVTIIRLS